MYIRNGFDAGRSITWASGRGLGPGNRDFCEPFEMAVIHSASAIWDPKKLIPLPIPESVVRNNLYAKAVA
jgi:hypothetical protein